MTCQATRSSSGLVLEDTNVIELESVPFLLIMSQFTVNLIALLVTISHSVRVRVKHRVYVSKLNHSTNNHA